MNGLLVVDKPDGITSHDVVARVRNIAGERSIGHLGTLDPMATGVLPLLMGKYTRLAQYFAAAEKSYTGTIRFGFATDTYDTEGEPAGPDANPALALDCVRAVAARFHGEMEQTPPPFSAKKIHGKPAYKLAREGKPVELKAAAIRIFSFEIARVEGAEAHFTVTLSAGGYVRSIAHEMGTALGCGAHLSRLRRTRSGAFTLEQAHTLEELEAVKGNVEALEEKCVHPRSLLPELPAVCGDEPALGRLRNGAQANLPEFSDAPLVKVFEGQRNLVGIAKRVAGTLFQPVVVLSGQ
ncbi:MAG: tRNA pseudouridine(55) synthase TruB [Terracidiphilus sp.]